VIRSSNLGWHDLPLRHLLENAVDLPVTVDRNTDAALLGEEWWGSVRAQDPVIFVTVGSGVGAALKVHGGLVYGASDAAGEFGHIPVVPDGPRCRCGSRGCLETLTSVRALLARYRELRRAAGTPLRRRPTVASIASAAADDPLAGQALGEVADRLGNGLATLVAIVNPGVIVLGGELMEAEAVVLPRIVDILDKRGPDAPGAGVEVMRSTFRDQASLVGAATLGFAALFAGIGDRFVTPSNRVREDPSARDAGRRAVRTDRTVAAASPGSQRA
jgi:glucokinase